MKAARFTRFYEDEDAADTAMVRSNRAYKRAGNKVDTACLVDGPDDNFAVVDLQTAIELGGPYRWSVR